MLGCESCPCTWGFLNESPVGLACLPVRTRDLQGDKAPQVAVKGAEYHAHSASAKFLLQLVASGIAKVGCVDDARCSV